MEIVRIKTARLAANTGQVEGLPSNPRQWGKAEIDRLAKSLRETPELFEARPCLVYPHGKSYIVLGGNMRLAAAKQNGEAEVPCIVFPPETSADKLREIVIKDNGSFGEWDFDALANEWDDLPINDWGVEIWGMSAKSDLGLSTEGRVAAEGYDEFLEKFQPKLTTDDCYTPPAVYEAVRAFVGDIYNLKGKKIERPFVPGGDYENYQYQPNSVVVDNPPFSILSKILRFYCANEIPFFLFGPELTLFSAADCDVTYIIADAHIIYENGADVCTGFITNLIPDLRVWVCPELGRRIAEAQPQEDKTKQGFVYPDNIITSAILAKIAKRDIELKVRKLSCEYIKQSDSAEEQGRALFGGGFIMSDRAAAERAAAERAAATRLNLSDREKAIIERLNQQDTEL